MLGKKSLLASLHNCKVWNISSKMSGIPIAEESPASSSKPRVFRISEIPSSWTAEKLKLALNSQGIKTLSNPQLIPSVISPSSCTSTVTLDDAAKFLQRFKQNPSTECTLPFEEANLFIDQHFYGLTAISSPSTDIKADIVAVHGLSGHAFGSWAHSDREHQRITMWLRDFLAEDVSGIRIIIYGYEARLDKTTTISRLVDYRRSFLRQLISSRRTTQERPLVLFGHSFGGIIIGQALETAKLEQDKQEMSALLRNVQGVFFFGVPHRGLRTTEIMQMTEARTEDSKTKLLVDLEKDSETSRRILETLAALSTSIQFVSIYEELQTSSVKMDPQGRWMDTGTPQTMVHESSATLNLPFEVKIPATANHKTIVKYSHRDSLYHMVKDVLSDLLAKLPPIAGASTPISFSEVSGHLRSGNGLDDAGGLDSQIKLEQSSKATQPRATRYAVVNVPYTLREVKLGSLVPDKRRPNQDARSPNATLRNETDFTWRSQKNFNFFHEIPRQSLVRSMLAKLFSISTEQDSDSGNRLWSREGRIYELTQPRELFETMCRSNEVKEWLTRNNDDGYKIHFIVGYRTFFNATGTDTPALSEPKWETTSLTHGMTDHAESDAATPDIRSEQTASHRLKRPEVQRFEIPGERIFAICFRKVHFKWLKSKHVDSAYLSKDTVWISASVGRGDDDDVVEVELRNDQETSDGVFAISDMEREDYYIPRDVDSDEESAEGADAEID